MPPASASMRSFSPTLRSLSLNHHLHQSHEHRHFLPPSRLAQQARSAFSLFLRGFRALGLSRESPTDSLLVLRYGSPTHLPLYFFAYPDLSHRPILPRPCTRAVGRTGHQASHDCPCTPAQGSCPRVSHSTLILDRLLADTLQGAL